MLEPIIEHNHLCENQDTFFHPHTECNYEILIQAPEGCTLDYVHSSQCAGAGY
jgi:hypothetical protein